MSQKPSLPSGVGDILHAARERVSRDPHHDLPLPLRRRIYAILDYDILGSRNKGAGQRRRVRLFRNSIERVLPIWSSTVIEDSTPVMVLELARDVLDLKVSRVDAWSERDTLWTHFDDLIYHHPEYFKCITIGYGAVQTLVAAINDSVFTEAVAEGVTDFDIEPAEFDPAMCAAGAYADGMVWDKSSSKIKRRDFWEWWLGAVRLLWREDE